MPWCKARWIIQLFFSAKNEGKDEYWKGWQSLFYMTDIFKNLFNYQEKKEQNNYVKTKQHATKKKKKKKKESTMKSGNTSRQTTIQT